MNDVHRGVDSGFNAAAAQALPHDHVGDNLGIRRGVKDGALLFQRGTKLIGVDKIPVVRQSHTALVVVDEQRLDVAEIIRAGSGVAHVGDGDIALPQRIQLFAAEHLAHQAHTPAGTEDAVVVQRNPRAFLPPVLQGVQTEAGKGREVRANGGPDPEYAAFLMDAAIHPVVIHHAHTDGA